MPSRYDTCDVIRNSKKVDSTGSTTKVRRLSSVFYPDYSNNKDIYVISQLGDRLDVLALEYLGDETLWYVIARVNNLGRGTLVIPPGTTIRIPYYDGYTGIAALFNDFNDMR